MARQKSSQFYKHHFWTNRTKLRWNAETKMDLRLWCVVLLLWSCTTRVWVEWTVQMPNARHIHVAGDPRNGGVLSMLILSNLKQTTKQKWMERLFVLSWSESFFHVIIHENIVNVDDLLWRVHHLVHSVSNTFPWIFLRHYSAEFAVLVDSDDVPHMAAKNAIRHIPYLYVSHQFSSFTNWRYCLLRYCKFVIT